MSVSKTATLKSYVSLPAWGAWVEMKLDSSNYSHREVAPRMGSVG